MDAPANGESRSVGPERIEPDGVGSDGGTSRSIVPDRKALAIGFTMVDSFSRVAFIRTATLCLCAPRFCKRWYRHGTAPPETNPPPPTGEELAAAIAETNAAKVEALRAEGRVLVLKRGIGSHARCLHALKTKHREATRKLRGGLQQLRRDHHHTMQSMDEKHGRALQQMKEEHGRTLQRQNEKNARALERLEDENARARQQLKEKEELARKLRKAEDDLLVATIKLGCGSEELARERRIRRTGAQSCS
ncbi:hypothetical protein MMC15_005026 [Xylographa vitiligo]|nr:hypothetical protein [Xylographa vitiligo]